MPAQQQRLPANPKGPVQTLRHRSLRATIWRNETEKGTMFNVTLSRGYKDDRGEWQDSGSFGYDHLGSLAALLLEAHGVITSLIAKENSSRSATRSSR